MVLSALPLSMDGCYAHRKRILIVDDSKTMTAIVFQILQDANSEGGTTVPSFGPRGHRCGCAGALRIDHGISANRPHMLTG